MPNAHLLGLYHRICKLLFYKIKPVFVFDGPAPQLKRETINRRRQHRSKDVKKAKQASAKILDNYLRSQSIVQQLKRQTLAVEKVVKQGSEGISSLLHNRIAKKEKDLFELPDLPKDAEVFVASSEESSDSETEGILRRLGLDEVSDVHQVDVTSDKFSSLPKAVQYDLLTELKEKRKQNSWAKMHEMPQKAEGFSGFQFERLLRRRQVQKKLEDVEAELNEETSRNFKTNPNLFVGDKEGILKAKTEVRKIASQADRHILFMSGLSGQNNDEGEEEEEVDDPEDVSRVIAESMLDQDGLSQTEILNIIKAPKEVAEDSRSSKNAVIDLGSDSDDDVILLPSGSVVQSNRLGGRSASRANSIDEVERTLVKIEDSEDIKPLVEELKPLVEKPKCNEGIVISFDIPKRKDDVEEMSDSGSSSDESEDLFADVFDGEQNAESLDDILSKAVVPNYINSITTAKNSEIKIVQDTRKDDFGNILFNEVVPKAVKRVAPKNEVDELIEIASKFDKAKDIFADISKRARKESLEPPKSDTNNSVTQDIAKSLKSSDHLFMKIAGRWADDAAKSPVKSNNTEAAKTPTKTGKVTSFDSKKSALSAELEDEQNKLIKEMEEKEKQSRLMKFQNLNYDQPKNSEPQIQKRKIETTTKSGSLNQVTAKPHSISKDEVKALQKLGVTSKDSDTYKNNVLLEEGLTTSPSSPPPKPSSSSPPPPSSSSSTIYSASAPGFVRSGKDASNTVDVSNVGFDDGVELSEELANALVKKSGGEAEMTEDELYSIQARLAKEQESLVAERAKAERVAGSLTEQMYMECQELLQMFGVPWIVAPTEAEAQCAFLEIAGLTNGTITDDSDVWLFGGQNVYKNFFNQDKHVECFGAEEIQQHFGLDREKLSLLAMLTGSDYSDGVEGVGPVTALEILAEFPGKGIDPLKHFREWWDKSHQDYAMPIGSKRREKFRKLNLPPRFPNEAILAAYLTPQVDQSGEKFSWAVPNLVEVRDFAMDKFGWGKLQCDQLLKPVIRSLENNKSQTRIDNYFHR